MNEDEIKKLINSAKFNLKVKKEKKTYTIKDIPKNEKERNEKFRKDSIS